MISSNLSFCSCTLLELVRTSWPSCKQLCKPTANDSNTCEAKFSSKRFPRSLVGIIRPIFRRFESRPFFVQTHSDF